MIPLAKPDIRKEDFKHIQSVLESGFLVQGKFVKQLESTFSKSTQSKHTLAVSNGTATMHLGLLALGIGEGDEVIVPAFSYVATANVVELVGAKPVFVDINLSTFNIDVLKIEEKISTKTKAILAVHEFGLSADIDTLKEICEKHSLYLLEDAACAYGAKYKGKHVGSFGEWGSFSLHPRKAITTGEGGIICTSNNKVAEFVQVNRNHGFDPNEGFVSAGFNYRLTDLQASLFIGQNNRIVENLKFKQELAELYNERIINDSFILPFTPSYAEHAWQSYHILLKDDQNRTNIIQELLNLGVQTNYGAQCIPEMPFYKKKYNYNSSIDFPNAYKAYNNGLVIPNYFGLTTDDINHIIKSLNKI